jgi:Fe-S cluster assembly protein SufD
LGSTTAALGARPELVREALETLAIDRDRSFSALNGALFSDGFVLDVAPGVALDRPIEIVHLASDKVSASLHTAAWWRSGPRAAFGWSRVLPDRAATGAMT